MKQKLDGYVTGIDIDGLSSSRKKAYYTAVGKERYTLYKMNAIKESQGYEILTVSGCNDGKISVSASKRKISEIKAIEIIISNTKCDNKTVATVKFDVYLNNITDLNNRLDNYTVSLNQSIPQTINATVHKNIESNISSITLVKTSPSDDVTYDIKSVKVIYE